MIVKLMPALKSYIWGGTNLKDKWNKDTDVPTLSEAWELSFHTEGLSVIAEGEFAGKALAEVAKLSDCGRKCADMPFFPVLCKLIDAAQPLSVQVHPTDEYALTHEGQYGKDEMWHILDAKQGAFLYLGLKHDMTPDAFSAAIEDKTITEHLNAVTVHPGDTFFIPGGTIHAIGAGITLYEVQQNSNLTYRIYDFDRKDSTGKHRELHVEKAKHAANLAAYAVPCPDRGEMLGQCRYFTVRRMRGRAVLGEADSFCALTVTDGEISLAGLHLRKGETAFMSAGEHAEANGDGTYLVTTV